MTSWSTSDIVGPDGEDWRVPVSELEARQTRLAEMLAEASLFWIQLTPICANGVSPFGSERFSFASRSSSSSGVNSSSKPVSCHTDVGSHLLLLSWQQLN